MALTYINITFVRDYFGCSLRILQVMGLIYLQCMNINKKLQFEARYSTHDKIMFQTTTIIN